MTYSNIYKQIELQRNTKIIAYATSDRKGMEKSISDDVVDIFAEHLESIGDVEKISLLFYTVGGSVATSWQLINLLRSYCKILEIIVPSKCLSAGTIMCMGADSIIMTKQSILGPIDPSIISPLIPTIKDSSCKQRISISVESLEGYFQLFKEQIHSGDEKSLLLACSKLTESIHPLILGDAYRIRHQIIMLAKKLLVMGHIDSEKIDNIINFMCSECGSHDYTISRSEAKNIGLQVEYPSEELSLLTLLWYKEIKKQMLFDKPYTPLKELNHKNEKKYCNTRAIVESLDYGCHHYQSNGLLRKYINPDNSNNIEILDERTSDAWVHTLN